MHDYADLPGEDSQPYYNDLISMLALYAKCFKVPIM